MSFKLMDLGGDPSEICNAQNRRLFKAVTVQWSTPKPLPKSDDVDLGEEFLEPGYLYALVRNHGRSHYRDWIVYIGISNDLMTRFKNHPKVDEIRKIRGCCSISIGKIDFGRYLTAKNAGNRRAIEELEHIYIWTLYDDLWNEKKQYTLPGMGRHGGRAWDIVNEGYKFSGRMPRRIVYPWIMVDVRNDRTRKPM
jgi:hypothetical protein